MRTVEGLYPFPALEVRKVPTGARGIFNFFTHVCEKSMKDHQMSKGSPCYEIDKKNQKKKRKKVDQKITENGKIQKKLPQR